jgi:hypothetical protein
MIPQRIRDLLLLIMVSACTIEPQGSKQNIEFHPPLVYSNWKTQNFIDSDGQPSCTISSGYNGIAVTMHRTQNNNINVAVKSEQKLTPGVFLTVNVGGHTYRTYGIFTGSLAEQLVDDLYKSDKAYLERSELTTMSRRRRSWTNIVKLKEFKPQLDTCRQSILS